MTDLISYTLVYPDSDGVEHITVEEGGLSSDKFYRASIVIDNSHGEIVKNRYGKTSLDALTDVTEQKFDNASAEITISLSHVQAAELIHRLL